MSNRNAIPRGMTSRAMLSPDEELRRELLGEDDPGFVPPSFVVPPAVDLPEYDPADAALESLGANWLPPPDLSHRDSPARLRDVDTRGGLPPGAPQPDLRNLEPGPAPQSSGGTVSEGRMGKILQALAAAGTASKLPDSFYSPVPDTAAADERRRQAGEMHTARLADMRDRTALAREAAMAKRHAGDLQRERLDPASEISQQVRDAFVETAAATNPEWLAKHREVIETRSADWIEKHMVPLMSTANRQEFDAARRAADERARADREAAKAAERATAAQRRAAEKDQAAAGKASKADAAYYLEGYELNPDAAPSKREAESIRKAQASSRTMKQTIDEIESLHRQFGSEALPSAAKARMSSLVTDLQLILKGPEFYALGILAGPDVEILERVAPNPTNAKANVLSFVGGDQTFEKLRTLRSQVDRRFANSARSLGYSPRTAAPNQSAPRSGKVRVSNGRETFVISAEDIAEARRDGFKPVGE